MYLVEKDLYLLNAAARGRMSRVKEALTAGAAVDGSPTLPCPPIVAATITNQAAVVMHLLDQGADPDKPVTKWLQHHIAFGMAGERALHIAARARNVDLVRLLLQRSSPNLDAVDHTGRTPLLVACSCLPVCVKVVRLLLEAGADPAVAEEDGLVPMHSAAINAEIGVVDMLYPRAPATLNRCAPNGATPLLLACAKGHEGMVSKLLSLGAIPPWLAETVNTGCYTCPLAIAVKEGFVGVVRILINEGGLKAVGGRTALTPALYVAVRYFRQARILRLLLAAHGEERRSEAANRRFDGSHQLHIGAGCCCPAAVSILLEAGGDEAARDSQGRIPLDVIGSEIGMVRDDEPQMEWGKEVAIRRMLQRGPAYRARSWAWPPDEEADAGGSGDDYTVTAATTTVSASPSSAVKTPPVIGVRIFRSREKNGSKPFVRIIGRYCEKD